MCSVSLPIEDAQKSGSPDELFACVAGLCFQAAQLLLVSTIQANNLGFELPMVAFENSSERLALPV